MDKFKNKIKQLNLCLSDLFIVLGFACFSVFLFYGPTFMQHPNPADVDLKLPIIIVVFIFLLLNCGFYIVLEYKKGNVTCSKYVPLFFVAISLLGIISIAIQPSHFVVDFISTYGHDIHVEMDISVTHYFFFTFELISVLIFVFIGIFILPKRFTSLKVIQVLGYAIFFGCLALIVYSYFAEYDSYKNFLDAIKNFDVQAVKQYCIKSFIINSNAYGMALLIGIIFCCINHSISPKWWYFPLAAFFYINMFFSFCRASMIISAILLLIYIYQVLIKTLREHKIRNIVFLFIITSVLLCLGLTLAISYFSKGAVFAKLYKLLELFNGHTINAREEIWNNTYKILIGQGTALSMFFGRGFGLINEMLLQANLACLFDNQYVFPTHNAYLNLFAEGGMIYLFSYLALLGYILYKLIKLYKKIPTLALTLSFGIIAFTFYSLIETIHYLVYPFMMLMLIGENIYNKNPNQFK